MSFLACGPTAFQYYRIPPQILGLYPAILPPDHDHRLVHYSKQPVFKDLLGTPVWRFVGERKQRANGKLFHSRLLTKSHLPGRLGRLNTVLMSRRPSLRCSALLRWSHATSYSWLATRCAAPLQCLSPVKERNNNSMKLFHLSSFHPTAAGSVLSTPRAMALTCGSACRFFPQRISPRSPSRPQPARR